MTNARQAGECDGGTTTPLIFRSVSIISKLQQAISEVVPKEGYFDDVVDSKLSKPLKWIL